jgi:hypothetical protein
MGIVVQSLKLDIIRRRNELTAKVARRQQVTSAEVHQEGGQLVVRKARAQAAIAALRLGDYPLDRFAIAPPSALVGAKYCSESGGSQPLSKRRDCRLSVLR